MFVKLWTISELLSEITYTHVYLYYNVIILDKVIKVEILMEQALKLQVYYLTQLVITFINIFRKNIVT